MELACEAQAESRVIHRSISKEKNSREKNGSVAKNILTTFYSGNESVFATLSCVASEFLQQSLLGAVIQGCGDGRLFFATQPPMEILR
jgi:hypothetical protein